MVAVEEGPTDGYWCITLQPNITTNWRQTLLIYSAIATALLSVAVALSLRGLWPVLVYAGATVWALGWALYVSAYRSNEWDVVNIRGDFIEVRQGRRHGEYRWMLQTYWTEVALLPFGHRWYPSRLVLRSRGTAIEIGHFLHDRERAELAQLLRRCIGPMGGSVRRV